MLAALVVVIVVVDMDMPKDVTLRDTNENFVCSYKISRKYQF